ncbi:MAG: DUF501 domain-containing protein [Actinomycetota bacterium]
MIEYSASPLDEAEVAQLVGRPMAGRFRVVVRRRTGEPMVIENEPHLRDGTPMPTLYWLVDPEVTDQVSVLESTGGVHRYELLISPEEIEAIHDRYAARRRAAVSLHEGPQPSGGVGGTRRGLKCLHAHVANYLAGHDDAVGALVVSEIHVPPMILVAT